MDSKVERANKEKVLRRTAKLLLSAGFIRTKPTFFTRVTSLVIEFVHIHKFSFDSSFRVQLGLRVISDPFEAVALNGLNSDAYRGPDSSTGKRYNFRFHESDDTLDRCATNIAQFIRDVGEPWFSSCRDLSKLTSSQTSPLHMEAKAALAQALVGEVNTQHAAKTRELLNIP